jgi:hypothetical protein
MSAPLGVAERRDAHVVATNAVLLTLFERFGTLPRADDRLWRLDPLNDSKFVVEIELKLGAAFKDADIEFLERPDDLIERGASVLMRARE